jgi:beta-glucanase (GH16 family)
MRASVGALRALHAARMGVLGATLGMMLLAGCAGSAPSVPAGGAAPVPSSAATSTPPSEEWRLVWSDEFEGTGLDRSRWSVRHASTMGDGNQELACLMDRPENVRVADGILTVTARREAVPLICGDSDRRFPEGRLFSSGFLETRDKAEFEYGRFEVRAKLPVAHGTSKGLWPAFWMRPSDMGVGEIDVLEGVGSAVDEPDLSGALLQAIHHDYDGTHPMQKRIHLERSGSFADAFHDFAVEWTPTSLRWYVDDRLTYERTPRTTSWFTAAFNRPYFLRLNLAVGGSVPGDPDADTRFPADFLVDWVRVYER